MEMNSSELKVCIDSGIEYVVKYPDKEKIDELISIITDSSKKQNLLLDTENTFQNFISDILKQRKK